MLCTSLTVLPGRVDYPLWLTDKLIWRSMLLIAAVYAKMSKLAGRAHKYTKYADLKTGKHVFI